MIVHSSPMKILSRILLEMSTLIFFVALISNSFLNNPLKLTTLIYLLSFFRYYTVAPEERIRLNLQDPLCELFPKMAACRYQRYGMGGREDNRHAICILGLNMINDKVFIVLWVWHCFICTVGTIRIFTRARYCRAI